MQKPTISSSTQTDPRAIAEFVLGPIEWRDAITGYCHCPGESVHTHRTAGQHCRVTLDNVPTAFCFHSSCAGQIQAANHSLRSAVAKGALAGKPSAKPWQRTAEAIAATKERGRYATMKLKAKAGMANILNKYLIDPEDLWERSPVRLTEDAVNDWRLLLQLFEPDDVIWIGSVQDSCDHNADDRRKTECRKHFRSVTDWLTSPTAPGQFTSPSVFESDIHSRSTANILVRRYLVVESDTLTKAQIGAVFMWCHQFMRLRAVVDTAGRSLHGWFDAPGAASEKELKIILPELGCDPALFKLAQPCRLPGAARDGKIQSLLYLDLGDSP